MNNLIINRLVNNPAVTVVVPAYNHARYIVEALESVRLQTFENWVMIVIDDGSTDDTWQVLQSYQKQVADPRIQIMTQANAGSHATINRGLGLSTTPYLAILNSDDVYSPLRLARLMEIAENSNHPAFVVTGVTLIDSNSSPVASLHWWQSMYRDIVSRWHAHQMHHADNPAVQTLLWGNFTISTSNFFMSREVWKKIGALKHLRYIPDWDFALRVADELPQSFLFLPEESLLSYRLHGQNTILGGALCNHAEAVRVLREFQKKWVAKGHQLTPAAIDRLHYLNRFIRHEHARQALERQKTGWVEQVQAVTNSLNQAQTLSKSWQQQADQLRTESEAWQRQADQLRIESEAWRRQFELTMSSQSWRLTRPLRSGKQHLMMVARRTKRFAGRILRRASPVDVTAANAYDDWLKNEAKMLESLQKRLPDILQSLPSQPLISIVMPVHNTPPALLQAAVTSVQNQWYENWELCICNDASDRADTLNLLKALEKSDSRIKCVHRSSSGHIALATNDATALAQGYFIAFLDHDDELAAHALLMLVQKLQQMPDADLLYSDEDKIDEKGQRSLPFFKPDWSPVLEWSQNYVGHLMCVRSTLLRELGCLTPGTQGSQDHDLVLRLAAHGAKIIHIPQVLYHWRVHAASTSSNPEAKPYAHSAGKDAVSRHLRFRYPEQFDRVEDSDYGFVYTPRFKVAPNALASIIIPTLDKADLLKACIDSIHQATELNCYEILVLDNGSREPETAAYFHQLAGDPRVRVIEAHIPFNWSRLNNIGRQHAQGQVLVFLNNDTVVISPDWLQRLMEYALLPDVAIVGPLLLYPDKTIQHAGVVVGMGGWADHVFKGQEVTHYPSPFVSSVLPRNVLAVTGACMAISTERFDQLGGFDEEFQICGSDVELGIRGHLQGYLNVYLPTARLYHLESKTRSAEVPDVDFKQSAIKYAPFRLDGDPFFNPNLDKQLSTPTARYPANHLI